MYPTIDKIETGKRIRELMIENNYSVKDIKEYLNLTCVQSVYRWFEGKSLPTVDNFYALSALFNVKIDDMICGNRKRIAEEAFMKRIYRYYIGLNELKVA